jgi:hypothetical protein
VLSIPIGTKITATIQGAVWKFPRCESCYREYVYLLVRATQGSGSNILWADKDGATRRAETAARKRLEAVLNKDFDAFPCPDCGMYTPYMVRLLKKRHWPAVRQVGVFVVVTFFLCMLFVTALTSASYEGNLKIALSPPWVYAFFLGYQRWESGGARNGPSTRTPGHAIALARFARPSADRFVKRNLSEGQAKPKSDAPDGPNYTNPTNCVRDPVSLPQPCLRHLALGTHRSPALKRWAIFMPSLRDELRHRAAN